MRNLARITLSITLGVMLLILVMATNLHASVPEIDPTNTIAPMALLAGAVLVIRGRIKR